MNKHFQSSILKILYAAFILAGFVIIGCGGEENKYDSQGQTQVGTSSGEGTGTGLTEFEMKHGIGPIKKVIELSSVDVALAKKGEDIFNTKCSACHKLDERYVGPAQRDVLDRRSPEYVMNMMLNPEEMYKNHPEAKKLFTEYLTPMPNQNLSEEDARAVLEYFRHINQ